MSKLQKRIEQRVRAEAKYILRYEGTIRQVAKVFGVSKSTVHRDLTKRLKVHSPSTAKQIRIILEYNKSIRHVRGGLSTKQKWISEKAA